MTYRVPSNVDPIGRLRYVVWRNEYNKCSSHDSEERLFSRVAKAPLAVTYLIKLNRMDITCSGTVSDIGKVPTPIQYVQIFHLDGTIAVTNDKKFINGVSSFNEFQDDKASGRKNASIFVLDGV
ncbi:hypothetical protein YC2023_024482 [Brassica napus]